MARQWRTLVALLVGLALVAGIAVAAHVDHAHKRAVMDRLEEAEWFCANRGERCGGERSADVEDRWRDREAIYETAMGLVGTAVALVALRGVVRSRRALRPARLHD